MGGEAWRERILEGNSDSGWKKQETEKTWNGLELQ